jgi:zinc transporter, ZIP family
MVPKAHKEQNWLPTFGAVIGFIVGFGIVRALG